jgi:exodeoxyribonuclease VII large subunit
LLQKRGQEVKTTARSFTQSAQFYFQKEKEVQRLATFGIRRNSELIFNRNNQILEQVALVLQKDVSAALSNASWILGIQTKQLAHAADIVLASGKQQLQGTTITLSGGALHQVRLETMVLNNTEKLLSLVNPDEVLKRGYSITTVGNVVLKYPGQVQEGDALKTIFAGGVVISTAIKIIKPESDE